MNIYYVPLVGKDRLSSAMSSWKLMSFRRFKMYVKISVVQGRKW